MFFCLLEDRAKVSCAHICLYSGCQLSARSECYGQLISPAERSVVVGAINLIDPQICLALVQIDMSSEKATCMSTNKTSQKNLFTNVS